MEQDHSFEVGKYISYEILLSNGYLGEQLSSMAFMHKLNYSISNTSPLNDYSPFEAEILGIHP